MIQRQLYLYVVAAASLLMLLIGLTNLGTTTLDLLLRAGGVASTYRDAYASYGALTLVGLPVWAIHWGIAQRLSVRNADERASALRRLYLYLVSTALAVSAALFARRLLEQLVGPGLGSTAFDPAGLGDSVWKTLLLLVFWTYHFRTAATDRNAVGEAGAGATLRRWYAYILLTFGLALLLFGARSLLEQAWVTLLQPGVTIGSGRTIASPLATMLSGLAVWLFHSGWTGRGTIAGDDRRATLRSVQGFLALAVSVGLSLFGASQLLYYALARSLGVARPGGVSGDLPVALAGPASTALVFGFAWIWLRRRLAQDAAGAEASRQPGVRRLYVHLVAFLAMTTVAIGVAGILWTLSDQFLSHLLARPIGDWRDRASLFITLAVVGTPMWLTHWRPTAERQTLSRRLYLYAALLGSVLALLISGATLVYRLLGLVLATSQARSGAATVDIGRAGSVLLVALVVGAYHRRVLRADAALRPAPAQIPRLGGGEFILEVAGASEDEIRRVLSRLPQGASYSLAPRSSGQLTNSGPPQPGP